MRNNVARLLVALGTLFAVLSILALWANRQALDTENWVETSSELLEQEVIRDELAAYMVEQLYANVDVEGEIQSILPPRAKPLAGPAAAGLEDAAEQGLRKLLERPRTQQLWEDANRVTHRELIDVLKDRNQNVGTADGNVTLDLKSLINAASDRIPALNKVSGKLPADAAEIKILKADELEFAQDVVRLLEVLKWLLVLIMLAFFGAAIYVGRDRRRETLRACGIGLAVAGILVLVVHSLASNGIVDALAGSDAVKPAVSKTVEIATAMLVDIAVATIAYGVFAIAGAVLAGPTRAATTVRRTIAPWIADRWIAYGALLLFVALLIAWGPTPGTRLLAPMLLLIALLVAGLEALRRQIMNEHPPGTARAAG